MAVLPNQHYLHLTRKDRRGTLVLLTLIAMICVVPFLYPLFGTSPVSKSNAFDSTLGKLQTKRSAMTDPAIPSSYGGESYKYKQPAYSYSGSNALSKAELFSFDPNTISAEGWKKLGLRDKTISTIMNYRSKGGKFKKADDIKKIWGLFPDEAERLLPFVNIVNTTTAPAPGPRNYSRDFNTIKKYEPRSYAPVSINDPDTSAWIALPGIGAKLSQRIINFRNKLGGFYAVEQVRETFGLPDSTFQKIKPYLREGGDIKKINLNSATLEQLKDHPYIRYHLANALFQYRVQHGDYKAVSDIRKIMIVTEDIFNKISPYLAVE